MEATRNKPKCKDDCLEHVFEIKNNNGNTKLDTQVRFCPKFRRDPHRPEKTIPQYNLDHKYYTKAFVLGTDKKSLASNAQHEQVNFQTMIKDACEKNNQVMFPKPNEKNSYCSVCKEHFKNYYEHINTQLHRIKIDAAIYNNEIEKLCKFFKGKWNGAHDKADQILADLVRQNELYQNGLTQDQNNEDQDSQEQNGEESSQGAQEQQNQEMVNENQGQQENQQGNEEINQQQIQAEDAPIIQPIRKQSVAKQKLIVPQPDEPVLKQKTNYLNSPFFEKRQLVLFLKKNKNGNYEVVKDLQKQIEKPQPKISMTPLPIQEQPKPITDEKVKVRQQKKKVKQNGKGRQVHKIKYPEREKQISSQYRNDSSSNQYQEQRICEKLKKQIMKDRIKTRNQCKEDNYQSMEIVSKPKNEKKQSQSHDRKQQTSKDNPKQSEQPIKNAQVPNQIQTDRPAQNQNQIQNNQYNNLRPMPTMMPNMAQKQAMSQMGQGYPIYMPSSVPVNHMAMGGKPNGNPNQQNRMGGYNPHAPMMMNPPPYYNSGMMNYGMSMRNQGMPSNDKMKDRQQQQPPYPMYYSNSWGPMMMNPHSMMRPERAGEGMPNNVRPQMPQNYQMMPIQPNSQKGAPQGMGSSMHPNMNMYMPPYPMDPHYPYMDYPYPPPSAKKNEQHP